MRLSRSLSSDMVKPLCGSRTQKGIPCRNKAIPSIEGGFLKCYTHMSKSDFSLEDDSFGDNRRNRFSYESLVAESMQGRDDRNFRTKDSEGNQIVTVDTGNSYIWGNTLHPLMLDEKVYLPYDRTKTPHTVVSVGTAYSGPLLKITQKVR